MCEEQLNDLTLWTGFSRAKELLFLCYDSNNQFKSQLRNL